MKGSKRDIVAPRDCTHVIGRDGCVLDEGRIPTDELLGRPGNVFAELVRLETSRDPEGVRQAVARLIKTLATPENSSPRRALSGWIRRLVLKRRPTIVRDGKFRLFFFSREELRIHVHVAHPDGETKFWLTPDVHLAVNVGLRATQIRQAQAVVLAHQKEIENA